MADSTISTPSSSATADVGPSRRREPDLHPIEASALHARRERVFLILAGIFIGAMAMLNILGITKFIHLGPLAVAVGVLPYPLTFLCTDFISELFGRKRANFVVFTGLLVNLLVLGFVWLGDAAEPIEARTETQRIVTMPYVSVLQEGPDGESAPIVDPATGYALARPAVPVVDPETGETVLRPVENVALAPIPGVDDPDALRLVDADTGTPLIREELLFDRIALMTRQAMLASLIAYLAAQFVDVWLFHFWKRLTKGRYLWLRNNGSTMVSQAVDATCVVGITFAGQIVSGEIALATVLTLIGSNYLFKVVAAAVDTIPFYFGVRRLGRYLEIDPNAEHDADAEEARMSERRVDSGV